MIAKRQVVQRAVLAAALVLAAAPQAWGQVKKAPTKKTTTAPPVVTPTASEGSTATAIRGRPASTAAGRAVNGALKTALAKANVQNAVKAEVQRQVRVRRPRALVNGYWVTVIDLASVYQAAAVRPVLLASLGVNGPQLINDAALSVDRLMLAFTPGAFGQVVLPEFTADITKTLGVNAVRGHMTDIGPIVMILVLAGSGFLTTFSLANSLAGFLDWLGREDPPECEDRSETGDCDGDGKQNSEDDYPFDPEKSICDCGRPHAGISLTTSIAADVLQSLVRIQTATQAQSARALSLGRLTQGQAGTLAVIF
jgi:hypothetical protein